MRCGKAQRWISANHDGELDAERLKTVQRHLASCGRCRAYAADLGGLGDVLDSVSVVEPRWGYENRLAARIANVEPDSGRSRWVRPWPVGIGAAAFSAGVALVIVANGDTPTGNPPRTDAVALLADSYLGTTTQAALEDELINLMPRAED